MVRLSVEQMARAVGLVEGVRPLRRYAESQCNKEVLISAFFSLLNRTSWYYFSSSLKGYNFVIKRSSFSVCLSVRRFVCQLIRTKTQL